MPTSIYILLILNAAKIISRDETVGWVRLPVNHEAVAKNKFLPFCTLYDSLGCTGSRWIQHTSGNDAEKCLMTYPGWPAIIVYAHGGGPGKRMEPEELDLRILNYEWQADINNFWSIYKTDKAVIHLFSYISYLSSTFLPLLFYQHPCQRRLNKGTSSHRLQQGRAVSSQQQAARRRYTASRTSQDITHQYSREKRSNALLSSKRSRKRYAATAMSSCTLSELTVALVLGLHSARTSQHGSELVLL